MNKKLLGILVAVITILGALGIYYLYKDDFNNTDHKKFSDEYTFVDENNIFVYTSAEKIIDILQKGTGIIYLGFPECPWCQQYVKILNETAMNNGINTIYYYNILEDRQKNTKIYQQILSILKDYLLYDDENNPRIYVPDVTFVKNGVIVAHNNDTSVVTKEDGDAENYWTEEKKSILVNELTNYIKEIQKETCTTCNK